MKALAQLVVHDKMEVQIALRMTVEEVTMLLRRFDTVEAWPVHQLKHVLQDTLRRLKESYESEHEVSQ